MKCEVVFMSRPFGRHGGRRALLVCPFSVLLTLLLTVAGCASGGGKRPDPTHGWQLAVEARYLYGPVKGKLQTPTGGNPGTTTNNRPTLKELGFEHASVPDVSATTDLGNHRIYAGYRFLRLSGSSTLDQPLISQGHSFPAGESVSADVTLDWFRVGYAHRFVVNLPGDQLPDLALYPAVGAAILNFDYRLQQRGPGGDVHRSYILPTPQIGLGAEWPLTGRLALVADGLVSIPVGSQPLINSGEIGARYRIVDDRRLRVDAFIGVAYDHIQYNDDARQTVPNDIDVRFGPAVVAVLAFRF
jgi:hypothetical protein